MEEDVVVVTKRPNRRNSMSAIPEAPLKPSMDFNPIIVLSKKQQESIRRQSLKKEAESEPALEAVEEEEDNHAQRQQEEEKARVQALAELQRAQQEEEEQRQREEEEELERIRLETAQQLKTKEALEKQLRAKSAADAVLKAQEIANGIQQMKQQQSRQSKKSEEAKKLQQAKEEAEAARAAVEAAEAAERLAAEKALFEKQQFAIVSKIQARFRGSIVRAQRKRKLSMIHAKLEKANAAAKQNPSSVIGARTTHAIEVLKSYAASNDPKLLASASKPRKVVSVKELLDACKSLEFSTEVSKNCCKNLIRGETGSLLLHLIRTCDRSRDSQELLHHALITLLNVARYDDLAFFVSSGDNSSLATIIDLLQMFRDKKEVFSVACELMCRIITADENAKVIIRMWMMNALCLYVNRLCVRVRLRTSLALSPSPRLWRVSSRLRPV